MSCFVTRPEIPVPGICEMSTPFSSAIARTTGDERRLSSSSFDSPGCGGSDGGIGGRRGGRGGRGADF